MQTFLPYTDFQMSAYVLDWRRLNAMRRESKSILTYCRETREGNRKWKNQPLTKQWYGYELALSYYRRCIMTEWERRGYKNSETNPVPDVTPDTPGFEWPNWLGDTQYHQSHRFVLCKKAYDAEAGVKGVLIDEHYDYRYRWYWIKNEQYRNAEYTYVISDKWLKEFGND